MKSENSDLRTSVARLERQLRTLKALVGMTLIVLIVGAFTAKSRLQGDSMTAERYLVLDADGNPRGMFGVLADGGIGMMFTDEMGTQRVDVRVDINGVPRIAIMDDTGNVRGEMGMRDDGTPNLVLADAASQPRVALNVSPGGSAQLLFVGQDGSTRQAILGTLDDGRPVLLLANAAGETVFQQPSGPMPLPADTTTGR